MIPGQNAGANLIRQKVDLRSEAYLSDEPTSILDFVQAIYENSEGRVPR